MDTYGKIEMNKCNILGVDVAVINMAEAVENIVNYLPEIKGRYICVSNVHTIVMASEDEYYRDVQNSGYMVLPDGKPLSVVSRLKGFSSAQRVTGPDLMHQIFNFSEKRPIRHFFYGSTDKTLDSLKNSLKDKYPELLIAGMYSPPFRVLTDEEDNEIIDLINQANPDLIWVGLGAPKQEIWMYNHQDKLDGLMVGVGAGFDYYANNIKRAPGWMQSLSLEWLYRLIQDPKRLWKRYLVYNTRFVYLVIKEAVTGSA